MPNDQEDIKPPRKEPIMQPMRVVQVPESPVSAVSTSVDKTPNNPTGKKLVKGKKEIEAEIRMKSKPVAKPILPAHVIAENNARLIDDLDRNTKTGRNVEQAPDYDLDWVKETGGRLITIAWLQTAVSVSGFISSESTFSPQKIRGLTMSWSTDGLLCKIDNTNGVKILLIPSANVKIMEIL